MATSRNDERLLTQQRAMSVQKLGGVVGGRHCSTERLWCTTGNHSNAPRKYVWMDEPWGHNAKWNKPVTERQILHNSTPFKSLECPNSETENRMAVSSGCAEGRVGKCLMGTVCFARWKALWRFKTHTVGTLLCLASFTHHVLKSHLCESLICFLILQNSISLHRSIVIYPFTHECIFLLFLVLWQLWIKMLGTCMYKSFYRHTFSFILDKYIWVELNHLYRCQTVFQMVVPCYVTTNSCENSGCSTFLSTLVIVMFLNFSRSSGYVRFQLLFPWCLLVLSIFSYTYCIADTVSQPVTCLFIFLSVLLRAKVFNSD